MKEHTNGCTSCKNHITQLVASLESALECINTIQTQNLCSLCVNPNCKGEDGVEHCACFRWKDAEKIEKLIKQVENNILSI